MLTLELNIHGVSYIDVRGVFNYYETINEYIDKMKKCMFLYFYGLIFYVNFQFSKYSNPAIIM